VWTLWTRIAAHQKTFSAFFGGIAKQSSGKVLTFDMNVFVMNTYGNPAAFMVDVAARDLRIHKVFVHRFGKDTQKPYTSCQKEFFLAQLHLHFLYGEVK